MDLKKHGKKGSQNLKNSEKMREGDDSITGSGNGNRIEVDGMVNDVGNSSVQVDRNVTDFNEKKENHKKKMELHSQDKGKHKGSGKDKETKKYKDHKKKLKLLSDKAELGADQETVLNVDAEKNLSNDSAMEIDEPNNKKYKGKKEKHQVDRKSASNEIIYDSNNEDVVQNGTSFVEVNNEMKNGGKKDKKKKKRKRVEDGDPVNNKRGYLDEKNESKVIEKKHDDSICIRDWQGKHSGYTEPKDGEEQMLSARTEGSNADAHAGDTKNGVDHKKKKKEETNKTEKCLSNRKSQKRMKRAKIDVKTTDGSLDHHTSSVKSKQVYFSDQVEVFTFSDVPGDGIDNLEEEDACDDPSDGVDAHGDSLVRGKRFTLEEDKKILEAVQNYIDSHQLGDEGLKMVLKCKYYPEVRNCWKEIGAAVPWRPHVSIYSRAHSLFERSEDRAWTPEEYELVRRFHESHGSDWRTLGDAMGKHRIHVKDAWRRSKLRNMKKGQWSQEEYQTLFDLVNMDLHMKVKEEYKVKKHGMLRDNIPWEAISDRLGTRNNGNCCKKWYTQLTSPLVVQGEWIEADDYRMVKALCALDACSMEEVDWDCLIEERSGYVCRKRWMEMIQHIGEHGNKSFFEQVEILSKRYCPELLEARETYDRKPVLH